MKQYFPLFVNHPEIVYLDNGASTQKPLSVIQAVADFTANHYANIHRGIYSLSEKSEHAYHESKRLVADLLHCKPSEVIYTYNASYALNHLAQTLVHSRVIEKGDAVLIGIREHHANVLPWQILAQEFGFEVRFISIDKNYDIDRSDFSSKYDEKVKVVSLSHVSNVTGKIYDLKTVKSKLRPETFFAVDGSQSVPNFPVDVSDIGCDALIFTGHKIMAQTGIGVLFLKSEWIKRLTPMIAGGGTVEDVSIEGHQLFGNSDKFESGTPNIIGAVSLGAAISFINQHGGMQAIWEHEKILSSAFLSGFQSHSDQISLIGPENASQRIAVFSFIPKNNKNFNQIGEFFAEKNICIRCGGHCAYPLHKSLKIGGTCRASGYRYNDLTDVQKFFLALDAFLKK